MTSFLASLSALFIVLKPKPSLGAERISFSLPVLGEFKLKIDSLETFAQDGTITRDLKFYTRHLDEATLTQLRGMLRQEFDLDPTIIRKITNAPIGEKLLRQLGEVIYTHPQRNGIYALRAAILLAATDSEGLTVINMLRKFPTEEIQVNTSLISSLIKETASFLAYRDSTVKAIAEIAETEINSQPPLDFSQLKDIRQPGAYSVKYQALTFPIDYVRQTNIGFTNSYNLDADIYLPKEINQSAPLVIITHGFGSSGSNFRYLGNYLASHGYIVIAPEHIGSNQEYQDAFLRGELSVDVSPIEFYSRPQDITYLLDELEQNTELNQLINWEQVGIFGHSFGGNTALAVAGAPINQARINQVCQQNQPSLNVSMLLQCRASGLPPVDSSQRDERIKVIIAANPFTSTALGVENMAKIDIPTMLLAGSEDTITPFIPEQAHPFLWLQTRHKYLGVMEGGGHDYLLNDGTAEGFAAFLSSPLTEVRRSYLQAMSLAFLEVHLRDNDDYQPYLTAAYARNISDEALPLHLIQSLTAEQLELAYGATAPETPIPEPLVVISPNKSEAVIAQIRQTKTLKVAMRSDAAPFGFIDDTNNLWTGYCNDFADSLGKYIAEELDIDGTIEVAKIPSNLDNRWQLVQDNIVHLECGSNTIQSNREDISFSKPILIGGTRFLIAQDEASSIDINSTLTNIKIGVLQNSTTEDFINSTYPKADKVYFQGDRGRREGIQALKEGRINTFVSDSILLLGEIEGQNLAPENYQLIPSQPLTCDFYGLILPQEQLNWRSLVNNFSIANNILKYVIYGLAIIVKSLCLMLAIA
ncbi:MAG: alpha/beta fold hydrolase [Cyanobacteria bacterium J06558_2]